MRSSFSGILRGILQWDPLGDPLGDRLGDPPGDPPSGGIPWGDSIVDNLLNLRCSIVDILGTIVTKKHPPEPFARAQLIFYIWVVPGVFLGHNRSQNINNGAAWLPTAAWLPRATWLPRFVPVRTGRVVTNCRQCSQFSRLIVDKLWTKFLLGVSLGLLGSSGGGVSS